MKPAPETTTMKDRSSLPRALLGAAGGAVSGAWPAARERLAKARGLADAAREGAQRAAEAAALRLVGEDFDDRVEAVATRYAARGGDVFGLDLEETRAALVSLAFLHRVWFRAEVFGLERVPSGPVLLVANHAGQLPFDAAEVSAALFFDAPSPRVVRTLVDRWTQRLPFVAPFFSRCGQVVGLPDNARRLLEDGECVLTFPEGIRGISKPWSRRYELETFSTGFVRLAAETGAPIVPIGIVGAEEQYLSFGSWKWAAERLGTPVFPLVPQVLLPGGQLPLPVRYRVRFGEPMTFPKTDSDLDHEALEARAWTVREAVAALVAEGLSSRRHVFR